MHAKAGATGVPCDTCLRVGALQVIADKMVRLKALLPGVDASRLVLRCPALVLFHEAAALEANLEKLR